MGGEAEERELLAAVFNFGGGALRRYDPVDIPSLVPWPHDALSSVRREC